jgi:hypothetical protein
LITRRTRPGAVIEVFQDGQGIQQGFAGGGLVAERTSAG